jgi:NitT/TauT family transport system substrate-binding protein
MNDSHGHQLITLRLTSLPNFAYLPQFVARALGYFADEHLEVELVTHTGPWSGLIEAAGRTADVVVGNMLFAHQEVRQPHVLMPVAYCLQQTRFVLCGARPVSGPAFDWHALDGASVLVPTDVPTPWIAFREALHTQGVSLDGVKAVVGYSSREAAEDLLAGAADFAVIDVDRLELSHLHALAPLAPLVGPVPWSVYFAPRADLAARPGVYRAFQRAIDRALHAIHAMSDDALADLVLPWFTAYDRSTATRIVARHHAIDAWPPTAAIPRQHVERWQEILVRWGLLPAATPLGDLLDFADTVDTRA